jgi:hypothetical protein
MHPTKIKFVDASQAQSIQKFTNIRRRLSYCYVNIQFNKLWLTHNVTTKYAKINTKTANVSKAAKRTEQQVRILGINNEIKVLYKTKLQLNKTLYTLHINNANKWGNMWNTSQNITHSLRNTIKQKYITSTPK